MNNVLKHEMQGGETRLRHPRKEPTTALALKPSRAKALSLLLEKQALAVSSSPHKNKRVKRNVNVITQTGSVDR